MILDDLIAELKKQKDWSYRQGLARQIAAFGSGAGQPLISILGEFAVPDDYYSEDSDSNLHHLVEETLVTIGLPAVNALLPLLNSDKWGERFGAIYCLHQIGDTRAIQPIVDSLESADHNAVNEIEVAMMAFGVTAVSSLLEALNHPNSFIREKAAYCLHGFGETEVIQELTEKALNDLVAEVRMSAIVSLNCSQDKSVNQTLTQLLQDSNAEVRELAQDLLDEHRGED